VNTIDELVGPGGPVRQRGYELCAPSNGSSTGINMHHKFILIVILLDHCLA
jgi:hypothetical protein